MIRRRKTHRRAPAPHICRHLARLLQQQLQRPLKVRDSLGGDVVEEHVFRNDNFGEVRWLGPHRRI